MGERRDDGGLPGVVVTPIPGDDAFLDTPNCAHCLTRMDVVEAASGGPYWRCAACGRARLA